MPAHIEDRGVLIAALRSWLVKLEGGGDAAPPAELAVALQAHDQLFYRQIAELTRRLHTAVVDLRLDERLTRIAGDAMPDARHRLRHVVQMTEDAAHRTLDIVDQMRVLARQLEHSATRLDDGEPRNALLRDAAALRERLNELAIAQEYQDLTGQIIKRVIVLVEDVEAALLELLGAHAGHLKTAAPLPIPEAQAVLAGPAIPGQVTTSQQDADALLASLGV